MPSTLTLADYAQLAPTNIERGVIDVFRRESFALDSLSFEASGGLSKTVIRSAGLPAVGFRKIGEGWQSSKATFEPLAEPLTGSSTRHSVSPLRSSTIA